MPRSTIINGKNKFIGKQKAKGLGDQVNIASATVNDKMVRRPAMVPGVEQNKLASEIMRLRLQINRLLESRNSIPVKETGFADQRSRSQNMNQAKISIKRAIKIKLSEA